MKKQGCDYLLLDISNLLYRTFYAQLSGDEDTIAGMAMHSALTTLNKYYKIYKPKKVVMVFDRSSWRKEYTAEYDYLKPYKGNRRKDQTEAQKAKYTKFIEHVAQFEKLINDHTTIILLAGERLEADDLIAGFVQRYTDDNIVIITADSDMAQLLKHDNVRLISPATDKDQSLEKYDNDPEYYLFQKCIRGDMSDNIQSAYPRVRTTRIKEIYDEGSSNNAYKKLIFMKEEWTDQLNRKFTVEQMYNHNRILIDLEKQPEDIKILINQTLDAEIDTMKKFSYFHLLKFVGKYKLQRIKDSIENFVPMLSL
jgi:5'-3' exonuclease